MKNRFLVCNVGWMEWYDGLGKGDPIVSSASFVKHERWGNEIYNFRSHKGRLYGGLFPGRIKRRYKGIDISKLGASPGNKKVHGVTVIWTAPRPHSGGTYVVGWYKKATVHREQRQAPKGANGPCQGSQASTVGITSRPRPKMERFSKVTSGLYQYHGEREE